MDLFLQSKHTLHFPFMTNLLYIKANFEDLSDLVVASQSWEPFFGDTSSTFCLKLI